MQPILFSFFSGCGLLDYGFEDSGYRVAFVNEYHEPFLEAYKHARCATKHVVPTYGYSGKNIESILSEDAGAIKGMVERERDNGLVGFIGGPPCPDFSIAGKNRGRHGDNGQLSLTYVNLIKAVQPDFFLFENVKGLWTTARHREFYEELKRKLNRAGYALTERLTNSLEFGAPQDRFRILLFGARKELVGSRNNVIQSFPWESHITHNLSAIKQMSWPDTDPFCENSRLAAPSGIDETLTIEHWFKKNDVVNHPNAACYFTPRQGLSRMREIPEGDVSRKSYKRPHRWRYSPTAAYGNNEVHLHPYKPRRLSIAEAMAIQSLPKEFELPQHMTLSNMFKTIGNGVPYLLAKGIAQSIYEYLESDLCEK